MTFKILMHCDGPDCLVEEPVPIPTAWPPEFPDSWIVIKLERACDGISKPTGRYGFHSLFCLVAWAANDVRYR